MTNGETQALIIADKYKGNVTTEEKIKWLATEVCEVAMAFQSGDEKHLLEEFGDCVFILSHLISRYDKEKKGIIHFILLASEKMERRNKAQNFLQPDVSGNEVLGVAVAFADWIEENKYKKCGIVSVNNERREVWMQPDRNISDEYTIETLYKKFKTQSAKSTDR